MPTQTDSHALVIELVFVEKKYYYYCCCCYLSDFPHPVKGVYIAFGENSSCFCRHARRKRVDF